eukprot:SAG11_NODE_25470_length_358_cov_0.992278_1_plen_79_part_10
MKRCRVQRLLRLLPFVLLLLFFMDYFSPYFAPPPMASLPAHGLWRNPETRHMHTKHSTRCMRKCLRWHNSAPTDQPPRT